MASQTPAAAQGSPWSLKLEQPAKFSGEMDAEQVEAWIFQTENYFALTGLVDENVKARYAVMLLTKSAAIWLRNQSYTLNTLAWTNLKQDIQTYFKPADQHRRARDALANCTQTHTVSRYIDAMKRLGQRVAGITDDEMLDKFIRGLRKSVQREVLKENPSTFSDACMLAERIGRLDDFVRESGGSGSRNGYAPMDIDVATAQRRQQDYLAQRYPQQQQDRRPTCYNCGKKGHLARECRLKKWGQTLPRQQRYYNYSKYPRPSFQPQYRPPMPNKGWNNNMQAPETYYRPQPPPPQARPPPTQPFGVPPLYQSQVPKN